MGGKSTLRTRIKALDKIISEYVRRKDADSNGMVRCITCGNQIHWKQAQAGHFWKRQHMATRFDAAHNIHVQDVRCNMYRGGAEAEHAAYIIREYGLEVFEDLERRRLQVKKWTRDEIESLILFYKQKVAEL